jgi:hypothetical protein
VCRYSSETAVVPADHSNCGALRPACGARSDGLVLVVALSLTAGVQTAFLALRAEQTDRQPGDDTRLGAKPIVRAMMIQKLSNWHYVLSGRGRSREWRRYSGNAKADEFVPKPPGQVRGRPFEKGRSGHPGGSPLAGVNQTLSRNCRTAAVDPEQTSTNICGKPLSLLMLS